MILKFLNNVKQQPVKQQEFWESSGSIKNIHLYIFRNLNFVFSVLICRSSVYVS